MDTKLSILIIFLFILLIQSPVFGSDTNRKVEGQIQQVSEEVDDEDITPSNIPGKPLSTMEDEDEGLIDDEEDEDESE